MNDCVSYSIWAEATAMVNDYFAGMTLASLLDKYKSRFRDPTPACPG